MSKSRKNQRAKGKAEFEALLELALVRAKRAARTRAKRDLLYYRQRSFEDLVESSLVSRLASVIVRQWIAVKDLDFWVEDLEDWLLELIEPELADAVMREVDRRMVKHAQKLGHIAIKGSFYSPTPKQRWPKIYAALHQYQ